MTATLTTDADLLAAYNTARDAYEEAHDAAVRALRLPHDWQRARFEADLNEAKEALRDAETALADAGCWELGGKHRRVA